MLEYDICVRESRMTKHELYKFDMSTFKSSLCFYLPKR